MSTPQTWSDAPRAESDLPERMAFASAVAKQISSIPSGEGSTVFGLVGPWGVGKTTLLTQIRSELTGWTTVEFAPWSASDADEVGREFVRSLSTAFPGDEASPVRKAFDKYAHFATPLLAAIPFVGSAIKGTADEVVATLTQQPPWPRIFKELSDAILKEAKQVLVVVDDVDRLDGDELRALLRVVRLLGRFPNVHYLLAYDQAGIESILNEVGFSGRSLSFLEKIVQFPFEVPHLSQATRTRLAADSIAGLADAAGRRLDQAQAERASELVGLLARALRTPRSIARFSAQVNSLASLAIAAELDLLDFAASTLLRTSLNALWDVLPDWRDDLTSPSWFEGDGTAMDRVVAKVGSEIETIPSWLTDLLGFMFPSLTSRASERPSGAIADPEYFARYFLLGIPEDDVSDALVAAGVGEVDSGEISVAANRLVAILDDQNDDARASVALEKAIRLRKKAGVGSKAMFEFVRSRIAARGGQIPSIGHPLVYLDRWLAIELVGPVMRREVTIEELVDSFGEAATIDLAGALAREYRADRDAIADAFVPLGSVILENLKTGTLEELASTGSLPARIQFAAQTVGPDAVSGLFRHLIRSSSDLQQVAAMFVTATRWFGADITYELQFARESFMLAVGADPLGELLDPFLELDPPELKYEDRETEAITKGEAQLFAGWSLREVALSATQGAASEEGSTAESTPAQD